MTKAHALSLLLHSPSGQNGNQDKRDLLCDILGISEDERMDSQLVNLPSVEQIQPHESPSSFVMRPQYDAEDEAIIVDILYNLVKMAIDEAEIETFQINGRNMRYEESDGSR